MIAIALMVLGTGAVAFAVADSLTLVSPRTIEPHGEPSTPVGTASDRSDSPAQGVLGAQASKPERRAEKNKKDGESKTQDRKAKRGDSDGDDVDTQVVAALIPAGSGGGPLNLPCSDTNSCVDHIGRLVTNVTGRIPDLPRLRECTSLIGGEAMCFHFGGGNYLVGDSPADGEAELGFCTNSGYYYVSGPSLGGGAGVACPGDGGGGEKTHGRDAPRSHECTSSSGGEATCFYFGGGNYLVSDSLADGGGELGFCTSSGYYYVSAPSAEGEAGVRCPGERAAG